jgi:hypothetical protein
MPAEPVPCAVEVATLHREPPAVALDPVAEFVFPDRAPEPVPRLDCSPARGMINSEGIGGKMFSSRVSNPSPQ